MLAVVTLSLPATSLAQTCPDATQNSYRVTHGGSATVDEHSTCKIVSNNTTGGRDIMVPTCSPEEWAAFRNNAPGGVGFTTCNCTLDGASVPEGDSITAYQPTRACGDACGDIDQVRTCSGGTLSGDNSYSEASCPAMEACLDCSSDDGVTIAHNTSDVLYTQQTEPCGSSCTGQTRNCWNGSLDGNASYKFANCTIEMCPFIVVMDPTLGTDGTSSTQVRIPAGIGTFNYDIRWSQGANNGEVENLTGAYTLALPGSGLVDVEIRGQFPHWRTTTTTDSAGIVDVKRWGAISWSSMRSMFSGESALVSFSAPDTPDLSSVTDMGRMFRGASNFNGDISNWDVSGTTNMSYLFSGAGSFNQPLNSWNVSNVSNMSRMFERATNFNQPLHSWNTSNVQHMDSMFRGVYRADGSETTSFNQPIGSWNVGNVRNMSYMFSNSHFNQDVKNWDVSSVQNMESMFDTANSFNQSIGIWDVSNVNNMRNMLRAASFNKNIDSWDTSSVTDMSYMFMNATSFNQPLGSWDTSGVTDMQGMFWSASSFDRDISGWCVSNIPSKPSNFDDVTSSSWTTSEKPNWGSCGAASGCESFVQYMRCTGSVLSSSSQAGAFACTGYCEGVSGASCCEYSSSFTCEATNGFADVGGSSSQSAANCN